MENIVYPITYAFIVALLAVGGWQRIQAARTAETLDRRQEGWALLIGIRLSGLALAAAAVVGFRRPPALAPPFQWAGLLLFAASVAWLSWMYVSLGRNLTDTVVTRRSAVFVSHGPYRYVRHPMYIGVLAAGTALGLIQGSWLVALGAVFCFALLALRTGIEENFLLARFGQTYKDYMAKVGRFWPRFL